MSALPARVRAVADRHHPLVRGAALFVVLVLAVYAALAVIAIARNWYFFDARGYWDTGVALANGGDLYPPVADQDDPFVYRYAPWFAWMWAGLSFLPREVVFAGWGAVMAGASAWVLWQLPRNVTGLALALLFGPMLLRVVSQGNVQPLMVAALTWGLWRRSGPAWIALSASLKFVPILFAALYVVRREYWRATLSVLLSVLLWLPALFYGLDNYPTRMGGEAFPFGAWTFAIAAAAVIGIFVTPQRYRALAAGVAVTFASPRWIPYNPTYLLPAVGRDQHAASNRGGLSR